MHKINPASVITFIALIFLECLYATKFTIAKISKKPTLPAVEILTRFSVFAITKVVAAEHFFKEI